MRLIAIRPYYFRGFGESDWINLDNDLVVLYGHNGYGKTSIAEAIEWLLYGKTRRRERGESLSQRDYQGSYRNAHAPETAKTCVEALIRFNGIEYNIKRELNIGPRNTEVTQTYINGNKADFLDIGINENEIYNPVIAQDNLQDFIHVKPKERRDKMSAILGLGTLIQYKAILEKVYSSLQRDPPEILRTAQQKFNRIISAMSNNRRISCVKEKWKSGKFNMDVDLEELQRITLEFLGINKGSYDEIVEELEKRRKNAERMVFDDNCIRPVSNLNDQLTKLNTQISDINSYIDGIEETIKNYIKVSAANYSKILLEFWEKGLGLLDQQNPNKCPMCGAETLTEDKRNEIELNIKESNEYLKCDQELRDQCINLVQLMKSLIANIKASFPCFLNKSQRDSILDLFGEERHVIDRFLVVHDDTSKFLNEYYDELNKMINNINSLYNKVTKPDTASGAVVEIRSMKNDITSFATSIPQLAREYSNAFEKLRPYLEQKIAKAESILEIDAFLEPIINRNVIYIIDKYNLLKNELLELIRSVESFIQIKQKQLFDERGNEISNWYNKLNPGAPVRYSRMETATDNILLLANTFGAEINAVSCLSQCQLNCLGLSIHFTRVFTIGNPFEFMVLDDPIQSMDDDHSQAFINEVIDELMQKGLQIIVLSHDKKFTDSIVNIYYDRSPLYLQMSDFKKSGPVIDMAESLMELIKKAHRYAEGNEECRRTAIITLRRCVEVLIRKTCRNADLEIPPGKRTAKEMLPYFAKCPNVESKDIQGLSETINFCDPAPHDEVGWPTPTYPQINPHIDRITNLGKKYTIIE